MAKKKLPPINPRAKWNAIYWLAFFSATLCAPLGAGSGNQAHCPPLPPPAGSFVVVGTVSELVQAVNNATPGLTILLSDGIYALDGAYLRIDVAGVALRGLSGNREAVVLDGNYLTTEIVQIVASDVTLADLTLREAYDHPIHVMSQSTGDTLNTLIYNVHIVDPGQQAIKINPYTGSNALFFPDQGTIACCLIELTDSGRPLIRNNCYTGGIDAHQAKDWWVRDNAIEGFWCAEGLSEHGIHFWRSGRDPIVERNVLRNNARAIGFGLVTSGSGIRTYPDHPCPGAAGGYVDHYGGVVRNNLIFADSAELFASQYGFDCGICLWNACEVQVLHNTVFSTAAPFSSIEWRFPYTDVQLINNLVSHNLRDRGGLSQLSGNLELAAASLFVNAPGGDLHLANEAWAAIDQGVTTTLCEEDVDGDPRPIGPAADIGADEHASCSRTDLNQNGEVGSEDLGLLMGSWACQSGQPCFLATADLDGDGNIDVKDAVLLLSCFGQP